MSESQPRRFPFAKLVLILAAAFCIGVGLCGLDYFLAGRGIGKSTEEFGVGPLDSVSLVVMFFSLLGLVPTLIAWIITGIVSAVLRSHRKD